MISALKRHHTIQSTFREFADISELVYFGKPESEQSYRYRGATLGGVSTKDSHFCHGTHKGYDVSAFLREAKHSNHEGDSIKSQWMVVALHLKTSDLPHVVLDAKRHDKVFYQSLFAKYHRMRRANGGLRQIAKLFDVYYVPERDHEVQNLLNDEILATIEGHYSAYDIELMDDQLMVYMRLPETGIARARVLSSMLEEATWLAERVEYRKAYAPELNQAQAIA